MCFTTDGGWGGVGAVVAQLTQNTDGNGATGTGPNFPYGPYLRSIPSLPVGSERGSTKVTAYSGAVPTTATSGYGWLYDGKGTILPNTGSAADSTGTLYTSY